MASEKLGPAGLLAALYDGEVYTPLFDSGAGAVCAAFGMVGGQGVYAVCQSGQPVGAADVKVSRRALKLAAETGNPVVTFYNSPGSKLDEGIKPLTAARKLAAAASKLSGVVPQIAVVTGVCGATSALVAAGADVCIMTKDAELFLTPPALSAAAGDKMPGAGKVEAAVDAGVVSLVADDEADAVAQAAKLLALLPGNNLASAGMFEFEQPAAAFDMAKYTGHGAIEALADADSAVELFAGFGDGIITALATVAGSTVGFAATAGPDSRMGYLCCARAARFMRLCDAYSIPVVTVLNSGGFVPSSEGDVAGNLRQAARLAATYADATTAKVAVLAGRTFGAQYAALADADLTIALEGSVTAPADTAAAATVLYKAEIDASGKPIEAATAEFAKKYEAEVAGAAALVRAGAADMLSSAADLRGKLAAALDVLGTKRTQRLPKKHGNMAL